MPQLLNMLLTVTLMSLTMNENVVIAKDCNYTFRVLNLVTNQDYLRLVQFTIDYINNQTIWLPNICIDLITENVTLDTIGSALYGLTKQLRIRDTIHAMIGPETNDPAAAVAGLGGYYYYIQQLTYSILSPDLTNLLIYPYFVRTSPSMGLANEAIMALMDYYNWTRVATISSDTTLTTQAANNFRNIANARQKSIVYSAFFTSYPQSALSAMKSVDVRINVAFTTTDATLKNRFECFVDDYDMIGERYQWIYNGDPNLAANDSTGNCTFEEQIRGSQGAFFFDPVAWYSNNTNLAELTCGQDFGTKVMNFMSQNGISENNSPYVRTLLDAVWLLVFAANNTLMTMGPDSLKLLYNKGFCQTSYSKLLIQDFIGFSGRVTLDGNGDRRSDSILFQVQNITLKPVGYYNYFTKKLTFNDTVWFPSGYPISDSIDVITVRLSVTGSTSWTFTGIAIIGILTSLASIAFNVYFSTYRFIRMSSHRLNSAMAVGCILCFVMVILLGIEPGTLSYFASGKSVDDWTCTARACCLLFGFDIAYGSMFVKTWRVHAIFSNRSLRRRPMKDWHLFLAVGLICSADVIVLIVWGVLDPLRWIVTSVSGGVNENKAVKYVTQVYQCTSSRGFYFMIFFYVFKGLMLIFGIFFAWETRKVQMEALNDSKQIGMCVYNVMLISVITVALQYILTLEQTVASYAVLCVALHVCAFCTLGLVFGPKVYAIVKHGNKVDELTNGPFTHGASNTQISSVPHPGDPHHAVHPTPMTHGSSHAHSSDDS